MDKSKQASERQNYHKDLPLIGDIDRVVVTSYDMVKSDNGEWVKEEEWRLRDTYIFNQRGDVEEWRQEDSSTIFTHFKYKYDSLGREIEAKDVHSKDYLATTDYATKTRCIKERVLGVDNAGNEMESSRTYLYDLNEAGKWVLREVWCEGVRECEDEVDEEGMRECSTANHNYDKEGRLVETLTERNDWIIGRSTLRYNPQSELLEERIWDFDKNTCRKIEYKHDERGNVTSCLLYHKEDFDSIGLIQSKYSEEGWEKLGDNEICELLDKQFEEIAFDSLSIEEYKVEYRK